MSVCLCGFCFFFFWLLISRFENRRPRTSWEGGRWAKQSVSQSVSPFLFSHSSSWRQQQQGMHVGLVGYKMW
jgi:hypothetical protein